MIAHGTKLIRNAAIMLVASLALTACGSATNSPDVRYGPQAIHPSDGGASAPTRTRSPKSRIPRTQANARANAIFDQYCMSGRSNRAIEATVRRSGKFKTPIILTPGRARYVIYPLADGTRGGITLVYNSVGKLRCAVSVENIGPSLYETGRITRTNI